MHARFFLISNFLAFCKSICYNLSVKKRWRAPVGAFSAFFYVLFTFKVWQNGGSKPAQIALPWQRTTPLKGGDMMEYIICFAFLVTVIVLIIKK